MRKQMCVMALALVSVCLTAATSVAGEAPQMAELTKAVDADANASAAVKTFIKAKLLPVCTNAVMVAQTTAQNAKKTSLAEIKKIDQEWTDAEDELAIHGEKTGNACAKAILKVIAANPAIVEAFVMDNQGANVGQNALTSDYWQGDEAKWQKSYNDGKGGVEISEPEFDKSANAQLQQISLPIINAKGEVIGAICYGVNLAKLK